MATKTKEAAIRSWRKAYRNFPGYVYRFPKGHWGTCSIGSPVGQRLSACGEIYAGVPASQWERIPPVGEDSSFELAKQRGYTGTLEEWEQDLRGSI